MEFQATVDASNAQQTPTTTNATVVQWDTIVHGTQIPLPDGFEDIEAFVAARESNPTERKLLEEARSKLAGQLAVSGIAKLRLMRGWSQKQLAHAIRTSQPHIARIEAGKSNLLLATALQLADVLNVSIEEIVAALKTDPRKAKG